MYGVTDGNGRWVRSIDPVSGRPTWTTDKHEAMGFTAERAVEYSEGIGRAARLMD